LSVSAAIIAVKNPDLNSVETGWPAKVSAAAITRFREEVKELFLKTGAVIAGVDGDTVLVAFGSPAERSALRAMKNEAPYDSDPQGRRNPVEKAASFLTGLLNSSKEAGRWYYGIDYGECAFAWTPVAGYTAFGPPSFNARLLAVQGRRHKVRIFISKNSADKISGATIRKHLLTDGSTSAELYEILTGRAGVNN
jgi:class 3 adenylate cyclase